MEKPPEYKAEQIINCLRDEYGLSIQTISFLPLGADPDSSVYRAVTKDKKSYFVKVRKGDFIEASVVIPSFLNASGIKQVIPPLVTRTGQLWANLKPSKVILYPFVEGHPGFARMMSKQQWFEYGTALKRFHATNIPADITSSIQKDNFSPRWREPFEVILEHVKKEIFNEPVAMEAIDFLKSKTDELLEAVKHTEKLGQILQEQSPEFILCHADIHGWNLFIGENDALYIVDWDALIFAPKERDLMFIGGGHGDSGYTPREEETMFYQGYGQTNINQYAMAYYRYDRSMEDLVADCDLIFLSDKGGDDLQETLEDLKSIFFPYGKMDRAYHSASKIVGF